jgi:FkbM family methyltransferase
LSVFLLDAARRVRLQALMAAQLENWREVWRAYRHGRRPPVLRFRDGGSLDHGERDAPVFLFLEIFANRCYERAMPPRLDGVVVDAGANIGAFTLRCASRYRGVSIQAYEPNPAARDVLRRNVTANGLGGRVTIWPEALGRTDGAIHFQVAGASLEGGVAAAGDSIEIPSVSLETVVARAGGAVALLKIDVEGAEADVFEGGAGSVRAIEHIVGEFHPAIVDDVAARLSAALSDDFTVRFNVTRRCGRVFAAARRPRTA